MLQKKIQNNNNIPIYEEEGIGATPENDDSYRYEIDTRILLEETYNNWLGKKKVNGKWVNDNLKNPMMTKELADKLIQSIRLKVNTHSLVSRYDDDRFIKKVAWGTAKTWNRALRFNLQKYKVGVDDYTVLVTVDIPYLIEQLLYAAKNGFMMQLRTEKGKIHISRQEGETPQGGL